MDSKGLIYVHHIFDEAKYLKNITEEISFDDFMADETYQRAAIRSLEIIGEAANKVPENIREQFPNVEWSEMYKMRNRLIHGYFNVELVLVWDTMISDIPVLYEQLSKILF